MFQIPIFLDAIVRTPAQDRLERLQKEMKNKKTEKPVVTACNAPLTAQRSVADLSKAGPSTSHQPSKDSQTHRSRLPMPIVEPQVPAEKKFTKRKSSEIQMDFKKYVSSSLYEVIDKTPTTYPKKSVQARIEKMPSFIPKNIDKTTPPSSSLQFTLKPKQTSPNDRVPSPRKSSSAISGAWKSRSVEKTPAQSRLKQIQIQLKSPKVKDGSFAAEKSATSSGGGLFGKISNLAKRVYKSVTGLEASTDSGQANEVMDVDMENSNDSFHSVNEQNDEEAMEWESNPMEILREVCSLLSRDFVQ